jgi:hypothetical protein
MGYKVIAGTLYSLVIIFRISFKKYTVLQEG